MSAYSSAVLALSPSLYWKLDVVSGATDQTSNGRNGSGAGGITIGGHSATAAPILGESATCTDFDGTNDFVDGPGGFQWANTATLTLSFWWSRDTVTNTQNLIGAPSGTDFQLIGYNSGSFSGAWQVIDGTQHNSTPNLNTVSWYFFALTVDRNADQQRFYQNAVADALNPITCTDGNPTALLRVGARGDGAQAYDGKLSHVAIFPSVLTSAQISALYSAALFPANASSKTTTAYENRVLSP